MEILSFAQFGYEGEIIKVETDVRRGIPAVDIVGLPDGAVKEARERVRAAIRNSGLAFPKGRVLINLSPANLKKEGSAFDLAIALSVLAAEEGLDAAGNSAPIMALGELELSGTVRTVRGISAAVAKAREEGIGAFILPDANPRDGGDIQGAEIHVVSTLTEAYGIVKAHTERKHAPRHPEVERIGCEPNGGAHSPPRQEDRLPDAEYRVIWQEPEEETGSFSDVCGQEKAIRALQIAAAGGHHAIMYGPPGCGKTMACRRFPSLLPKPDLDTAATITRIYSIAGISEPNPDSTPFRMPHQNCSLEGMAGGGRQCSPGEISLAHGGVLFLDEAALFRSSVLQSLRAPLESGKITLSRAGRQTTFPARFQLLAAMNPCPCGKFGVPGKVCTCTASMIEKYWQQLTEPLLDRLDVRVEVPIPGTSISKREKAARTEDIRKPIEAARRIQWRRNRNPRREYSGPDWLNAYLSPAEIAETCVLTKNADVFIKYAVERNKLSGRSVHSLMKTARTIADMEESADIQTRHLEEALCFRTWSASVPDFLA